VFVDARDGSDQHMDVGKSRSPPQVESIARKPHGIGTVEALRVQLGIDNTNGSYHWLD
tara:strand:+ start:4433 stop:4606 length:174 start_codon:yes stop_codon:yes gene_type:complete